MRSYFWLFLLSLLPVNWSVFQSNTDCGELAASHSHTSTSVLHCRLISGNIQHMVSMSSQFSGECVFVWAVLAPRQTTWDSQCLNWIVLIYLFRNLEQEEEPAGIQPLLLLQLPHVKNLLLGSRVHDTETMWDETILLINTMKHRRSRSHRPETELETWRTCVKHLVFLWTAAIYMLTSSRSPTLKPLHWFVSIALHHGIRVPM